ncbi:UvrD-helicase domain-containing protein [Pseudonocardia sp. T1-2H]|uniref:UvrD-helicase domain-containing protein n=1 Tax=Pseudonocardia sp. T1-2H TaxID=3128899 RepID=UPI00310170B3
MADFALTPEQQDFLDATDDGGPGIVCQAGAGAGKTTVMRKAGEKLAVRGKRGIYTAFNKAIVESASGTFPRNVTPQTTYSIAYQAGGHHYKRTLDITSQTLQDVARILRINEPLYLGKDVTPLAPNKVARLAIGTVDQFCASADDVLGAAHVPDVPGAEDARQHIIDTVLPLAVRAWEDMADPSGKHGGGKLRSKPGLYFKRWALTHPQIRADFLMVDEVQDTDPVLAGVLREQQLPMYLIGDDAQMIYGWRGCVSVMGDFPALHQLSLTKSFRFGTAVADEANKWLDLLDAKIRITGNDAVNSVVGPLTHPDAVLTRSNAEAVIEAIEAHKQGVKVHLKGAGDAVRALAEGAAQLQQGRTAWHPELAAFRTWGAVIQYVEDGQASTELENTVRLLDTHGIDVVEEALSKTVAEPYAERVVTTTHKVKGLEWSAVRIGNDWHPPRGDQDPSPETAMLAYVAVTRAKEQLDRGGLDWVDDYAGDAVPFAAADAAVAPAPAPEPVRERVELPAAAPVEEPEVVVPRTGVGRGVAVLRDWLDSDEGDPLSEEVLEDVVRRVVAAYLDSRVGAGERHLRAVGD